MSENTETKNGRLPVTTENKVLDDPTLKFIKLIDIILNPLNPRTEFDQDSLDDLTASILSVGVIQPITVRPVGKKYELVCGERRYRAALSVNAAHKTRNTIPASIRTLTDQECMELMVTENLQRKDVHPLEEANAFVMMIDKMNYSIADVGAKIGKNEQFVIRRLQLLKLIPDLQKIFKLNQLHIGHAELLSRIDIESQQFWLKDKFSHSWNGGEGTLKDLKEWLQSKVENRLNDASFKTDIAYPGDHFISALCTVCPQNSAFNNNLFPDTADKAICNNPHCFRSKSEAEFQKNLDKSLSDPKVIFINDGYGNKVETLSKKLKEDGYVVLSGWQEYSKLNKPDVNQWAGETDDKFAVRKQTAADKYAEDKARSVKAFDISSGKNVTVVLKKLGQDGKVEDNADLSKQAFLADIKQKTTRGIELDNEKIMKNQVALLKDLSFIKKPDENLDKLTVIETNALLCLAWSKASYESRGMIRKQLGMKESYGDHFSDFEQLMAAPDHIKAFIIRSAIFTSFNSISPDSLNGAVLSALAKDWSLSAYEKINDDQAKIRERRERNLDQKVKDFNKNLKAEKV